MEFCLAILLLRARAGLAEFTDEVVRSADVRAMVDRVRLEIDPEAEAAGYDLMTSIVRVHLKDGQVLEERCDFSRGQPANPMTAEELAAKFLENVDAVGVSEDRGREAHDRILDLENQTSLKPIIEALTPTRV